MASKFKNLKSKTEDKLAGMTGNVAKAASQWTKAANGISGKAQSTATETWDKLEQVFEDRVARALTRLGVPSQREVQALAKRVEELTDAINGLARKPARASATAAVAKKSPAKKASRK